MNTNKMAATCLDEPWGEPWPAEDLEPVACCPVCGDASREVLHPELIDNAFRAAPGKWMLRICAKCSSAYLDPRPTSVTIHRAYTNYYTHQAAARKDEYAALGPLRKLRRRLVNGYTNWRYGTTALPSSPFGVLAAFVMPPLKKVLDRQYRHLPKLPKGGGRLLDVGCGDGSFLSLARTCGWSVLGLDPDPAAVASACKQGLPVHKGGIEYFDGQTELFDVITLNHVIEHVYDPFEVLRRCQALLKVGGQLWLETPNIASFGHAWFQKNWRGLEAPRHLVIFNRLSLRSTLIRAGFSAPKDRSRPSACTGMFQASFAIAHGKSPYSSLENPKALQWQAKLASFAEIFVTSRREFLLVTARKETT